MRSRSTSDAEDPTGLPSVAALARFAIEREQLAREMGMDELGGPATLGVVNVGAGGQGRRSNGRTTGGKKRGSSRKGWNDGDTDIMKDEGAQRERRNAGEVLLEKLESIAEARSTKVLYTVNTTMVGGCHQGRCFRLVYCRT